LDEGVARELLEELAGEGFVAQVDERWSVPD
jgi:hypothetical protein